VIVALERMLDEGVDHLPVLDSDRRVVGICTRTDVLSARRRHFALDRRQTGWLRALS
jgi:CBS-domain-containing membrane protein